MNRKPWIILLLLLIAALASRKLLCTNRVNSNHYQEIHYRYLQSAFTTYLHQIIIYYNLNKSANQIFPVSRFLLFYLFTFEQSQCANKLILLLFLLCLFFLHVKNLFCNLNFGFLIRWKHDIQNDSKQCCRYDS